MEVGESSRSKEAAKSWADIISDPANDLKFIEIPESALVGGVLKLPKDVLDKGRERLKAAVVIQFLGIPPPFKVLVSMVNRLWGYEDQVIVSTLQDNFFLVEFNSVKLCDWVLSRSWHIHNKSMIMRKWERGIQPMIFSDSQNLEWIIFKKVPPDVISVEGVSWLCSLIGKPIKKFIREGLDVKVCIVRDKACPCPEVLTLEMVNEEIVNIEVVQVNPREYNGAQRRVWRVAKDQNKAVKIGIPEKVADPIILDSEGIVRDKVQAENVEVAAIPSVEVVSTPIGAEKVATENASIPLSGKKKTKKKKKKAQKKLGGDMDGVSGEGGSQSANVSVQDSIADNETEPFTKGEGSPTNAIHAQETEIPLISEVQGDGNESGKMTSEDDASFEVVNGRRKATFDEFLQFSKPAKQKVKHGSGV
ncbi:hypothetical protein LINPERPRIM_LOCUS14851 [Linum perenne]